VPFHLAFDDTDARDGMCSTFLVNRVLEAFPECDPVGLPRLVRLNPNVPWKTRGNAALALALGRGAGDPIAVAASLPAGRRHAYARAAPDDPVDPDEAFERLGAVLAEWARTDAEGTEPGWVVSRARPPRAFYERAVTDIVPLGDARAALEAAGARYSGLKGGRGLIGAAAALAWTPLDRTFEAIAYRAKPRWGSPRDVSEASVAAIGRAFPSTFDSYDDVNDEVVCVPSSPCPVLAGLRGDDPDALPRALATLVGESFAEWTLFETNQATDEHLVDLRPSEARALASARMPGRVLGEPWRAGGHAFVAFGDEGARVTLAAYAPTRALRDIVMALRPGDALIACGGLHAAPDNGLTLGLEKLRIDALAPRRVKVANPRCSACDRSMHSAGRGAGHRCKGCGAKAGEEAATWSDEPRRVPLGWHEAPARARRHLAMPLRRLGRSPQPLSAEPAMQAR